MKKRNIETEVKELHQRVNMVYKANLIFPWTWYVKENSVEFTTFENNNAKEKGIHTEGFAETIHIDDRDLYFRQLKPFTDDKESNFQITYRSNFFSEDYRWYVMTGEVFETDEEGYCTKAIGILQDVTGSRNSEEALKKHELQVLKEKEKAEEAARERKIALDNRIRQEHEIKRLNVLMDTILNNVPMYMYLKDPNDEFRYLYWNKATEESTKIPASKVLGKTDWDIFPDEKDALHCYNSDLALLENGDRISTYEEYMSAEGEIRSANTVKMLIPNNKEIPWILGMSWDITELKNTEKELIIAKEKAEESNRLKSAFLANMSHEIRTPLNAIVGFSELLVYADEVSEKEEFIKIIKKNNELLLQLISDILDISKIEARSLEFSYGNVDVNNLCVEIIAASNLKIDAKVPVVFGEHIDECYIQGDRNRINQVLTNLINNALKFTATGNIKVGYCLKPNAEIEFYVEDTGTGIPNDKKESIFDRFVKLDSFSQGTGLGLSICKSIIEQLKGTIGVDSVEGKGSRFWFKLPIGYALSS